MAYTVKELAELSHISVRTLHWYDAFGLLKPSYYGKNGYRYYEEAQLLVLHHILFLKELGFPLRKIKAILAQSDFDMIDSLYSQKITLEKKIAHQEKLIDTINKTIDHLTGEKKMNHEDFYYGIKSPKQKKYEAQLEDSIPSFSKENLVESKQRTAHWKKKQWCEIKNRSKEIHESLVEAIEKHVPHTSSTVQAIIESHFQMISLFYTPTKEVYTGLTDLYEKHPDFRKLYASYHPELLHYLGKAMRFYANTTLK